MNKIELHESERQETPQKPKPGQVWAHRNGNTYICDIQGRLVGLRGGGILMADFEPEYFRRITKPFTVTPDCDE